MNKDEINGKFTKTEGSVKEQAAKVLEKSLMLAKGQLGNAAGKAEKGRKD